MGETGYNGGSAPRETHHDEKAVRARFAVLHEKSYRNTMSSGHEPDLTHEERQEHDLLKEKIATWNSKSRTSEDQAEKLGLLGANELKHNPFAILGEKKLDDE